MCTSDAHSIRARARRGRRGIAGGPLVALLLTAGALAENAPIEELVVYGRAEQQLGIAASASEGLVARDDLRLPPLLRAGELAEAVPGMVATQHSGSGKANQYFLRGFELDHGTDFAARLDHVPLNMPSHGHGQGYLDLNPIIPELVEGTHWRKGTHHARDGNFSTAGAADFRYRTLIPDPIIQATAGEFGYRRGLLLGSVASSVGVTTAAVDVTRNEGPWQLDENLEAHRARLAHAVDIAGGRLHVALAGYEGRWTATDQIPRRAVLAGTLRRRGFVDPDLGGESRRIALDARLERPELELGAWHVRSDFALWSNFTYLLDDPAGGDEFEQRDARGTSGLWIEAERTVSLFGRGASWESGVELRHDDVDALGLHATAGRVRRATIRDDEVDETAAAAFSRLEIALSAATRAFAGVRLDTLHWDVDARRAQNSGSGHARRWSPSVGLARRFGRTVELYANWGEGFHSNDVRGATVTVDPRTGAPAERVAALAASRGGELGLRLETGRRFNASAVLFALDLDSELVFTGDAGTTEPRGATSRTGIEATAFWQLTDAFAANLAWTRVDARFEEAQEGGRRIPGAVEDTFALGVTWVAEHGPFASARLRHLGRAALLEDGSVTSGPSLLVNAGIGWRGEGLELRLDLLNALDSQDDDIAYFYASRLPGEGGAGVEDVHFHPLAPRSLRATVALRLGG